MGWKLTDGSGKQIWPARVVTDFYTDWVDRHHECYFMGEWQGALAEFSVLVHLIATKNVTPIFVFAHMPTKYVRKYV